MRAQRRLGEFTTSESRREVPRPRSNRVLLRQRGAGAAGVLAAILAVVLLAAPSATAGPVVTKIWKAPFAGTTFQSHYQAKAGCGTVGAVPTISVTTGQVSGAPKVTGTSCKSTSGSSYGFQRGELGIVTKKFTGIAGNHRVEVMWTLQFTGKLSEAGSDCKGSYAHVGVGLGAAWANLSGNATDVVGGTWAFYHNISTATYGSWKVAQNVTIMWFVNFVAADYYILNSGWGWDIAASSANPFPTGPAYSCSTSASISPVGTAIAVLDKIVIV